MTEPKAVSTPVFTARNKGTLRSGIFLIGFSTIIAGVIGYAITWLVPRQIGFERYADFASFWAFVFLIVATLSGIQQEVTRATRPGEGEEVDRRVWLFGGIVAVGVTSLVFGLSPLWIETVFPQQGWSIVWPLAAGTATYVFIAIVSGTLYGLERWHRLFAIVVCESVLRIAAVSIAAVFTSDLVVLAWAVVLPFPITAVILILFSRSVLFSTASIDVSLRGLTWNVARTVLASASMGLLVSGFPLLLAATSPDETRSYLALAILASTLVRAPLIVTSMALQSYFIVLFRARADRFWKVLLGIQGTVAALGTLLATFGFFWGPSVFRSLFPGEPAPDGWFVAGLIASSAVLGSLCVSAPAVLSRRAHTAFTTGWVAAALTTTGLLLLPLDLASRTVLALSAGPAVGLASNLAYLVARPDLTHRGPIHLRSKSRRASK